MIKVNYSEEDVRLMRNAYACAENDADRKQCVAGLASKLSKPEASIIAKLAKEGVYIKPTKISAVTKGEPRTKQQLVRDIEWISFAKEGTYDGLEKAPKLVLLKHLSDLWKLLGEFKEH